MPCKLCPISVPLVGCTSRLVVAGHPYVDNASKATSGREQTAHRSSDVFHDCIVDWRRCRFRCTPPRVFPPTYLMLVHIAPQHKEISTGAMTVMYACPIPSLVAGKKHE
ncbi:hypothetical protein DE146DRAFT_652581 [Phaeosphaeria sp. MPI-PUGE-AT-0046c]|nr:hypothetical protein DE146DRAFT_652581 [Phaeosphaeria sp. MPI-PUGE-AT-0046c]